MRVKMTKAVQETVEKEINSAIIADEQANAHYYQAIRRFISAKSTTPDAKMDAANLKEIDAAWLTIESTGKNLRRAYMKLYGVHFQHTF
jgi:hypothetical protein